MKLILVEWDDACSCGSWEARYDNELNITPCITCGILLREDEKEVEVALALNIRTKSNVLAIPKSCIKRMRRLHI